MTQQEAARHWAAIDIPKTIAGVLAAVSAAVVGSYLGVAGTLAGAAVASAIGSVGTELYQRWISRGSDQLRSKFVAAPAAVGTPEVAAAADESPSQPEPAPAARIRWNRVAAVAAGVFLLAIGTLTAFELISGKSAADAVGNRSSSTTTICSVLCADNKPTPTPATTGSTRPSATPSENTPTGTPSTPAPTVTSEPTLPITTAPATTAPPTQGPTGEAPPTPGAAAE